MAGPKVQFKITTRTNGRFTDPTVKCTGETENLFKPRYSEGQIIFVEDEGNIYLDFHGWRKCYTKGEGMDPTNIRFLGVSDDDPALAPASGTIHINGAEVTPKSNDMVVYNTKEYLYRDGTNGEGWYEIGDEDEPTWSDD